MGSNPVQAWIFFRPSIHYRLSSIHNCEDPFHIHVRIFRSSNIWLSYIHSRLFTTSRVYLEPTQWPAPSWLVSSGGRALHRFRKGHGFKSRRGLNIFFRPSFHHCLSSVHYCEDRFHIHDWSFLFAIRLYVTSPTVQQSSKCQNDKGIAFILLIYSLSVQSEIYFSIEGWKLSDIAAGKTFKNLILFEL